MNGQKQNFFATTMGRIVITVISALIVYGILIIGLNSQSNAVLFITLLVCGVFGWKALNKITPQMFLFLPIGGWIIYFLIKALLSCLIGGIIAPFQIGKMVSNAVSNKVN